MSMSVFVEEPYTNHLGQTLNPGDEIIMVASGYAHSVNIRRGKFLGVRKEKTYTGQVTDKNYSVTCEYERPFRRYNRDLPREVRYLDENIQTGIETVKTNLYLGRVYKIETNAWEIST